jgi:hypothetical protein
LFRFLGKEPIVENFFLLGAVIVVLGLVIATAYAIAFPGEERAKLSNWEKKRE